jgi:predicted permease
MTPDEARYAAERKLGNRLQIREEIYRMNTIGWIDALWQDVRFGLRLLARTPGFTAIAVLTLTLGIGANTAILQVVDAVRLRSLPVSHPEQLAEVRIARPRVRAGNFYSRYAELSNPQWEQIRDRQEAFASVMAWAPQMFQLSESGEVRRAEGLVVSGRFFEVLGVPAAFGRVLTDADDRPGCAPSGAVISHGFWQHEFGGDPAVVGRKLRLDNHLFEVVGVTPRSFHGVEVGRTFDVAIPVCAAAALSPDAGLADQGHVWWLASMGLLRPGWTAERATAHLRALSPSLFRHTVSDWFDAEARKRYLAFTLEAVPCAGGFSTLRADYTAPLWFLFGLSALVLLATCVNLANLLLARAGAREMELAVRLATGASRWRVVRQLLTESLLLAGIGTLAGAGVARGVSALLVASLARKPPIERRCAPG